MVIFISFDGSIIENINTPKQALSANLWLISFLVSIITQVIIMLGINWILKILHERKFVRLVILSFTVGEIINLTYSSWLMFEGHHDSFAIIKLFYLVNLCILAIALVFSFFLNNKPVRFYFRLYIVLLALAGLLPDFGAMLYDNFSCTNCLISNTFLLILPYLATLALFIRFYFKERHQWQSNQIAQQIFS